MDPLVEAAAIFDRGGALQGPDRVGVTRVGCKNGWAILNWAGWLTLCAIGLLAPSGLLAACEGDNLIAALPPEQRAELQAAADAQPFAKGNLWTAAKDGQTITLIGTYHLDDPRHGIIRARLPDMLATAKTVLVEAAPKEVSALQAHVAAHPERLMNAEGPPLTEALSDADWLRLSGAMLARGIQPVFAAKMQPWYISSVLAIPPCQFSQAGRAPGLDLQLVDLASDRAIPVVSLEPFDTVFGIFDSFSPQDQMAMLVQSLDTVAVDDDMAVTVADSYFSGENRLFWEFTRLQIMTASGVTQAEADRQLSLIEEAMIIRRNRAWLPVITAAAAEGPVVAAFGALHLSGVQGVLNLLAGEGWTVLRVDP